MPTALPRVCNRCKQPTPKGRPCRCRPAWEGSTHASGNDRRWQQVRKAQLANHPICQHPHCPRLATDVDHVVPLAEQGARFDYANLMSLCHPHHVEKTTQDALRGKSRAR